MALQRFVVIVNPASGRRRGRQVLEQVRPLFGAAHAELDVRFCEAQRHAFHIASELDFSAYDGCCVIGGDGTVHEVVNGLLQRCEEVPFPLGLIPAGSGNTLHLHLGTHDPTEATTKILAGETSSLDVARVTTPDGVVYCVNIIGWSAVVDINRAAERLRFLGPIRYGVATLGFILHPRRRLARLILDDQLSEDEFVLVIGCNTKYTGNGMNLAPRANLYDGKIDVIVVRKASRWELLRLFKRVFDGSHLSLPCVEYHQVQRFAIELDEQEPLDLDGEATGKAPFSVEMLPSVLRIFA
jgi:YegS/Rv2252/BmrU family lipid kinase